MVAPDDDIMLLSDSGVIIRTRVADIPVYGRAAAGVIVMRLTEGASLVSFAAVSPEDEESYGAEQAGQTEDAETPGKRGRRERLNLSSVRSRRESLCGTRFAAKTAKDMILRVVS